MTEKRFTYDYEDDKYYDKGFFKDNGKELYKDELLELLNTLHEENEQLKQKLKTKCIVNKQYEENQRLIKMLDNVANYMQKQHKDMPIDDFVEWWNNIATEGL